MKTSIENLNLSTGWTGELINVDLRTVPTLPPDSISSAFLVFDYPDSRVLSGLQVCLSRSESGE